MKVVVTQCAANMKNSSTKLPFNRFPCICHVINTRIGAFIKGISEIISPILQLESDLSTPSFKLFLEKNKSSRKSIPSFSKVRWFSLSEMLSAIVFLKDFIVPFSILENFSILPSTWDSIETLKPLFLLFSTVLKKLERMTLEIFPIF